MRIPDKVVVAASVALLVLAGVAGWRYFGRAAPDGPPCAQQQPGSFTAQCLAQARAAAGRGDAAAMMALADHFKGRQPEEAVRWTRAAAAQGEPRAVGAVLEACGAGRAFTLEDAQAVLPQASVLQALDFRLGGSCAPVDLAAARAFAPASVLAERDSARLCAVAVRYGQLRMTREGAQLDSLAAQQLLAECERRPQASAAIRHEAQAVRQMLAREIRPVHISAD
ncbi:hypothetical protein [Pseudoduganella sp.]|uniref:hypothetical protein n=1 Tax=Pseudoduganella sp. TaxID=1880898 RepID=UPI0035B4110A